MAKNKVLSSKTKIMQEQVKNAPLLPGVYIYRDKLDVILYIGKAKVLRNRIKSYFSNYKRVEEKIRQMIDQATSVEYLVADSEIEALILEQNLIKKYKPKYNSMMVDDKHYIYVKFQKPRVSDAQDTKKRQDYPKIEIVREIKDKDSDYFGPFPDSMPAKRLLKRLRRVFPYRTCNRKIIQTSNNPLSVNSSDPKPCLYYHIGLCKAPCAAYESKNDYQENFKNIIKFFKGQKPEIIKRLEKRMKKAAKDQEFEKAAQLRNQLRDIQYIGSNIHLDIDLDEVAIMKAKQDRRTKALHDLVTRLNFPARAMNPHPKNGFRMEAYDISNIQGKNAVGSMVVFIDGEPRPDLYRRFKIKMENEPNDFAMLQEVLTRRFKQLLKSMAFEENKADLPEEYTDLEGYTIKIPDELMKRLKSWQPDESFRELPDLIIIDGGKGQLSSTYKILQNYGLVDKLPIVGLAKREEELFKITEQFTEPADFMDEEVDPDIAVFTKVRLPRRSEALYLVQRIRDEAHRFAISYHRKLRSKALETK